MNFLSERLVFNRLLISIAAALCAQLDTAGTVSAKEHTTFETTFKSEYLKNGMLVSIYADQSMPIVSTQLVYNIGSAHEDENSRGLAHLFEHLMFSASKKYPERAVFEYVEQFGGSTNAFTSFDETTYVAGVPPNRFTGVLEIYADRMVNLVLTEEDLERDKKIVLEELRVNAQNDPIKRLAFEGLAAGFEGHPYALSPLGTEEDVNNVTMVSCLDFYARYYGPKNAHLIVVGPVEIAESFEFIETTFGEIEKDVEIPPPVPAFSDWSFPAEINLAEDIPPIEVAAAIFPLPSAKSPDHETLNLLISLLQGLEGFEDELVRKRRKALFAQSIDFQSKAGRILAFASGALPYRRKDAAYLYLDDALRELSSFAWLTDETLNAMKRRYLQTEYRGRYQASQMASRISFSHGSRDNIELAFSREERIAKVTKVDIVNAYRTYILNGNPTRLYIEPERVPWYVKAFGRFYPLADRLGLTGFVL